MDYEKTGEIMKPALEEPFRYFDILLLYLAAKTHDKKYPYGYDLYIKSTGIPGYQAGKKLKSFRARLNATQKNGKIVNPIPITPHGHVWKEVEKIAAAIYWGFSIVPITRTKNHEGQPNCGEDWLAANLSPAECKEAKKYVSEFRTRISELLDIS